MVKQVKPLEPIIKTPDKQKQRMVKQVKPLEHKEIEYDIVYKPITPKTPKRPEDKRARIIVKLISLVFVIIAGIFFIIMVNTLIEFNVSIAELKAEVQMDYPYMWEQVWNSSEVQGAISEGYIMFFADKAIFFVPLFILAIVVHVKGNKAIENRPSRITNSDPTTNNN